MKLGASKDGRITALESEALVHGGGYADHSLASVKLVVQWDIAESFSRRFPTCASKLEARTRTRFPRAACAGSGTVQFNMALGLAVDELAEELGLIPSTSSSRASVTSGRHPPMRAWRPWSAREPSGSAGRATHAPSGPVIDGRRRGLGFSFHRGVAFRVAGTRPRPGAGRDQAEPRPQRDPAGAYGRDRHGLQHLRRARLRRSAPVTWVRSRKTSSGSHPSTPRRASKTWSRPTAPVSYLHAEVMGTRRLRA